MPEIKWNAVKSERLKRVRGVSFEEIVKAKLIGIQQHPVRTDQKILVYEHKGYLWAVPYVVDGETIFLKTIYPSRKLLNIYRKDRLNEKN